VLPGNNPAGGAAAPVPGSMTDDADSKQLDAGEGPSRPAGQSAAPKMRSVRKSKYASEREALEGLKAFVVGLGVENPADTEAELLMQAAPYMSESLEANLQSAWTPEERARLDAAPIPEKLDHHNRDHEYIFFKQMRKSLERRMSRSSSGSKRESVERRTSAVQQRTSADTTVASLAASSSDSMPGSPLALTAEEASRRRAEQRRANLGVRCIPNLVFVAV